MRFQKRIFLNKIQMTRLINSLPGTIYQYRLWKDGRGTFPFSTLDIEHIFFATPSELAKDGQIAWNRLCPESTELVRDTLKNSAKNLSDFEITFGVRSPQDRIHWIRTSGIPKRLRDGSTLWQGYMEDITVKYLAEEAAKQKSAFIRAIFDNLEDRFYYKDRQSKVLGGNPAWVKLRGAESITELIGKTDMDLFPGEQGKQLYDKEQLQMATGEVTRTRERQVRQNGRIEYIDSVKCPMRNRDGEVIGVAGISRDITRQVENEEALLKAKLDAEQSASFIRAVFDNLTDRFYYKDRQSKILGGNLEWIKRSGAKSIDELVGKTDIDIHPVPLGQQLYDNEQRQMAAGEVARARERHVGLAGNIEYIDSVKCPMRNKDGEVIGVVGISRDVTEQVENEQRLIAAQQEAESANKAKSSFLAMMSHEIRTPMNGVIGAASLLLGTDLAPQQEEFVHTIQVSGENLLTIINDILDYSKIEAGKIELEASPFVLRGCVEDAFDLFVHIAAKKNIELLYYVDPDVPKMLIGDTTRLRQVLVNLLGNATKFTENGEIHLKIRNTLLDEDKKQCQIEFALHDTGIGIADEHKERLFQAFTQADASSTRKYGGTGLGLTISRKLTELMGGKIWFESEKGKGSTFYFTVTLPISEQVESRVDILPIEALRGKRALIIDDNETNRWLLSDQLAQWGVLSETFELPAKALEHLIDGHTYDIALVDYQMPDMDGSELAKEIYRLNPRLPIIILSSSCEHIPADPSIKARLFKPVKVGKLCNQMLMALSEIKVASDEKAKSGAHTQPKKKNALQVLVAEDNPINQRIAQMMLQRLGYEHPVLVGNGEEAVAAMMDTDYDIVLMDVQMPKMSGLEATIKIRELTGKHEKPWIIALTAGVMEDERAAAKKSGMNAFLAKPLVLEQLEEMLEHALGAPSTTSSNAKH
ncbi:MAG: response regulator [Kiritimatiellales bacterium]